MNYLDAIVLGLVQGLGEFLPISSSAHLIIAPWALGFKDPGLKYDVELHLGTLLAVLVYFWRDWWRIFQGSFQYLIKKSRSESDMFNCRLLTYIVLATIPAAIIGKFLDEYAERTFRDPRLIAFDMVILGALLWYADSRDDKAKLDLKSITFKAAMIIGLAQVLALIPGVSRSGITITTALLLGFRRPAAARFSFFLATPITFGAVLLKSKFFTAFTLDPVGLLGVAVSAFVGFLSIAYLMKLVQNFSYRIFCYYRFFFGAGVFLLYYF